MIGGELLPLPRHTRPARTQSLLVPLRGLRHFINCSKLALPFLECIDFVGELSGVDEASKDVVGEVAEPKRDSAEVF